jgi:hypothetical protein
MERIIFKEINDKKYPMACTLAALEYLNREKGGVEGFAKMLGGLENITATLDVTLVFIKQGIAKYKYERGDMPESDVCLDPPTREELELTLDVDDIMELSGAIIEAIKVSKKNTVAGKPAKGAKKNAE